ncbi:MAG: hypothetical protein MUF31_18240 [Akkermansiaceae bacterium]|jgi:hypothetical protein|nr:hypothetical protein [Akkermansiaceae bacterium]
MRTAIFLLLLMLVSCVTPASGPTDPASVRPLLPGTWVCKMGGHGIDAYMEKTFHPNGNAEGFIDLRKGSGTVALLAPRIPFRSRWKFDADGYLVTYDVRCEVEGIFEKGFTSRDRILRASSERIDFIEVDLGTRATFRKKTGPGPAPTSWSM